MSGDEKVKLADPELVKEAVAPSMVVSGADCSQWSLISAGASARL